MSRPPPVQAARFNLALGLGQFGQVDDGERHVYILRQSPGTVLLFSALISGPQDLVALYYYVQRRLHCRNTECPIKRIALGML